MQALIALAVFIAIWAGFTTFARNSRKASWTMSLGGGFLTACVGTVAIFSLLSTNSKSTNSKPGNDDSATTAAIQDSKKELRSPNGDLTNRCVAAALREGYKNGQCAFSYIDKCVTTQSKEEMAMSLKTDNMLGVVTGRNCPNMPSTYSKEFDSAAKARDKF